jgi:hypothetical protein
MISYYSLDLIINPNMQDVLIGAVAACSLGGAGSVGGEGSARA